MSNSPVEDDGENRVNSEETESDLQIQPPKDHRELIKESFDHFWMGKVDMGRYLQSYATNATQNAANQPSRAITRDAGMLIEVSCSCRVIDE